MKQYSLLIPAELSLSGASRTIAVSIFEAVGLNSKDVSRLKLVFDEIYMNAVKYGSLSGGNLSILFRCEGDILTVIFEDEGGKKEISASDLRKIIAYQKSNNDPTKKSGRGLAQIASQWAENVQVYEGTRGGLCVSFQKTISQNAQQNTQKQQSESIDTQSLEGLHQKKIELSGEVDDLNWTQKMEPIEKYITELKNPELLVINLQDLKFLNSTCIAKFMIVHKAMQEKQGALVLENVNDDIMEVFDLVGMTKLIPVFSGAWSAKSKS